MAALVDRDVVVRRLREIGRRLAALRALHEAGLTRFEEDLAVRAQVERHLQVAIQSGIDIALHLLAGDTDRTPEDYGSAFTLLTETGAIPSDLADRLRLAAGLRNLLVHAYLDIDPVLLWRHLERLDDLEAFAGWIVEHLDGP